MNLTPGPLMPTEEPLNKHEVLKLHILYLERYPNMQYEERMVMFEYISQLGEPAHGVKLPTHFPCPVPPGPPLYPASPVAPTPTVPTFTPLTASRGIDNKEFKGESHE